MDRRLEVVTGTGEVIRCDSITIRTSLMPCAEHMGHSASSHGLGSEARPNKVRLVQASYGSIRAMMSDIENHTRARSADLIHAFAARKTRQSIVTKMNSTETMPLDEEKVDKALLEVPGQWVYNLELVDFIGGPHGETHVVDPAKLNCEEGLVHAWEMDWTSFCFRSRPLFLKNRPIQSCVHGCRWTRRGSPVGSGIRWSGRWKTSETDPCCFPLKTDVVSAPWFRLPRTECCFFGAFCVGRIRRLPRGSRVDGGQ